MTRHVPILFFFGRRLVLAQQSSNLLLSVSRSNRRSTRCHRKIASAAVMPIRRRFGHVNIVCSRQVRMCGWEGGKSGQERGLKMGQWTLSMGPTRVVVLFFKQRATIPSKRILFYIYKHHTCNLYLIDACYVV